jgi:hypothetical protein
MKRRQKDDPPQRGKNSQQIRFGSITINIYTDPRNGLHTLSATVGGKRYKINRGRTTNVRNEAAKFASNIAEGIPEQVESLSQKKLEYFLALEKRMNGTPLDVAVDLFLAHQDDKLVKQRVPSKTRKGSAKSSINEPCRADALQYYQRLRGANRALGCDFFEGVVMKRADSAYPVQMRSATEEYRGWVKHRFLT